VGAFQKMQGGGKNGERVRRCARAEGPRLPPRISKDGKGTLKAIRDIPIPRERRGIHVPLTKNKGRNRSLRGRGSLRFGVEVSEIAPKYGIEYEKLQKGSPVSLWCAGEIPVLLDQKGRRRERRNARFARRIQRKSMVKNGGCGKKECGGG